MNLHTILCSKVFLRKFCQFCSILLLFRLVDEFITQKEVHGSNEILIWMHNRLLTIWNYSGNWCKIVEKWNSHVINKTVINKMDIILNIIFSQSILLCVFSFVFDKFRNCKANNCSLQCNNPSNHRPHRLLPPYVL